MPTHSRYRETLRFCGKPLLPEGKLVARFWLAISLIALMPVVSRVNVLTPADVASIDYYWPPSVGEDTLNLSILLIVRGRAGRERGVRSQSERDL